MLRAMLSDQEGIAVSITKKLGAATNRLVQDLDQAIEQLPKMGRLAESSLSQTSKAILDAAFAEATNMKDRYISIEHILLAIAD